MRWIIAKYAMDYWPDGKAPLYASVHDSHSFKEMGVTKPFYNDTEEDRMQLTADLEKLKSYNPSVLYGIVEVDEEAS